MKLCRNYVIAMNYYERNKQLRNDSTHAKLMKGTASGSQSLPCCGALARYVQCGVNIWSLSKLKVSSSGFLYADCSTTAYSGLHYWVPLILGNYHFEVSKALVEGLGLWVSSLQVEYLEVTNNEPTLFASPYRKKKETTLYLFFLAQSPTE